MTSALDARRALDRRYSGDQWVTISEARSGAGFDGNTGQCDYLAINAWPSKGLQVWGHEIKVSLSDWKRELDRPGKSDLFARVCRRWWIVAPSDLASKIKPELPPAWGLMSVADSGRITETVRAPSKDPAEIPAWWWIGWLTQIDRRDRRVAESEMQRRVSEAVTKAVDHERRTRADVRADRNERLEENARRFKEATGRDLLHVWQHDFDRFAVSWRLARSTVDLAGTARTLRASADLLDEMDEARSGA